MAVRPCTTFDEGVRVVQGQAPMSSDIIDREIQVGSDTGFNDSHRYPFILNIFHTAAGSQ